MMRKDIQATINPCPLALRCLSLSFNFTDFSGFHIDAFDPSSTPHSFTIPQIRRISIETITNRQ